MQRVTTIDYICSNISELLNNLIWKNGNGGRPFKSDPEIESKVNECSTNIVVEPMD